MNILFINTDATQLKTVKSRTVSTGLQKGSQKALAAALKNYNFHQTAKVISTSDCQPSVYLSGREQDL